MSSSEIRKISEKKYIPKIRHGKDKTFSFYHKTFVQTGNSQKVFSRNITIITNFLTPGKCAQHINIYKHIHRGSEMEKVQREVFFWCKTCTSTIFLLPNH